MSSFPSDVLAKLAFDQLDHLLERSRGILIRNSRLLTEVLNDAQRAGIVEWVRPPAGASIAFPKLVGTDDAGRFVTWLHDSFAVGVAPGAFFQAPAHFRVAVGGDPAAVESALNLLAVGLASWSDR